MHYRSVVPRVHSKITISLKTKDISGFFKLHLSSYPKFAPISPNGDYFLQNHQNTSKSSIITSTKNMKHIWSVTVTCRKSSSALPLEQEIFYFSSKFLSSFVEISVKFHRNFLSMASWSAAVYYLRSQLWRWWQCILGAVT